MDQQGLSLPSALLLGLMIGAGVAIGGYFVGEGFYRARSERYVTVKGLVERNVKADLGMWTISYTATGPDLNQANTAVVHDRQLVTAFASSRGFSAQDIEVQPTTVTDTFANRDNGREPSASERYLIKGGVKIRSGLVDKVRQASQ